MTHATLSAEQLRGCRAYAEQIGPLHERNCPADDTCNCKWKFANDGINAACDLSTESDMETVLENDRSQVAAGVTAIQKTLDQYSWLIGPGRGSYEWDDDNWKKEFGYAVENIRKALEPLARIAADWSNCPQDWKAVDAARQLIPRERAVAIVKKVFENEWWEKVDRCVTEIRSAT